MDIREGDYMHALDMSGIIVAIDNECVMLRDTTGQVEIVNLTDICLMIKRINFYAPADFISADKLEQLINDGLL